MKLKKGFPEGSYRDCEGCGERRSMFPFTYKSNGTILLCRECGHKSHTNRVMSLSEAESQGHKEDEEDEDVDEEQVKLI